MINIVVFNAVTGESKQTVHIPEEIAYFANEGEVFFEMGSWANDSNVYFDGVGPSEKQPMPLITIGTPLIANGTDEATISNIPEGVQVQWPDGQTDIVTGGEIRFSVDLAGTYPFRFTAVPYLDQEVVIEAIPAA